MAGEATAVLPRIPAGPLASIGVHVAAIVLLFFFNPLRPLPVPVVQSIEVEIVTPGELAPPPVPTPAPPVLATPPAVPTPLAPQAQVVEPGGQVTAQKFYTAAILQQPDMKRIRAILAQVADGDRVSQLCIIEGMEQIRLFAPQYEPDVIVPYAMADASTDGLTLVAPGGAFRSRRQWYEVAFRCTATADYEGVAAFSFHLGHLIPEAQWEDHNLNASDDDEPD